MFENNITNTFSKCSKLEHVKKTASKITFIQPPPESAASNILSVSLCSNCYVTNVLLHL